MPARSRSIRSLLAALLGVLTGFTSQLPGWLPAAGAAPARKTTALAVSLRGSVGWSGYTRLDLLPAVRQGVSTFQASSADPTGHNDDGYSGRYSCLRPVKLGCVMAEHDGPGELESVWTAGDQFESANPSGNLIIQLDGRTVVDTTWAALTAESPVSDFPFPLALAPDQSWFASSLQVPMPFRHQLRVISQFNPHYFHVVYRTFSTGAGLSTFRVSQAVPANVLAQLRRAGTRDPKPSMGAMRRQSRSFSLRPGQTLKVAQATGSGAITQIRLRLFQHPVSSAAVADVYEHARLRIRFDGAKTVDAPVGEFFGSGLGPAPVHSLMFAMDGTATGWNTSWWPMPFARSAVIEIYNGSRHTVSGGQLRLSWAGNGAWTGRLGRHGTSGYFHAWGHSGPTKPNAYWQFMSARGSGTFVGVTLTIRGGDPPYYLEGNERAYVDGARKPQIQGTGTEDFFDGGWYFHDHLFSLPLSGYTAHAARTGSCPGTCKSAYRLMIADGVSFNRSILYEIQHGPVNDIPARYSSTAYWYQRAAELARSSTH